MNTKIKSVRIENNEATECPEEQATHWAVWTNWTPNGDWVWLADFEDYRIAVAVAHLLEAGVQL